MIKLNNKAQTLKKVLIMNKIKIKYLDKYLEFLERKLIYYEKKQWLCLFF